MRRNVGRAACDDPQPDLLPGFDGSAEGGHCSGRAGCHGGEVLSHARFASAGIALGMLSELSGRKLFVVVWPQIGIIAPLLARTSFCQYRPDWEFKRQFKGLF